MACNRALIWRKPGQFCGDQCSAGCWMTAKADWGNFELNLRQAYKNVKVCIVIRLFLNNILASYESYEAYELKVTALNQKLIFSLVLNQNVQHSSSDMKSPKNMHNLKYGTPSLIYHYRAYIHCYFFFFFKSKFRVELLRKKKKLLHNTPTSGVFQFVPLSYCCTF